MTNTEFPYTYLEIYFILINIISFLIYSIDKLQAIRNNNKNIVSRISEKLLLLSSFVGGSIGSFLAMVIFRHKIKKLSFMIKFIIVVSMQIGIIYLIGGN